MKQAWKLVSPAILDDAHFDMLTNHLWRAAIEFMLVADEAGRLPDIGLLIWQMRAKFHRFNVMQALQALQEAGIVGCDEQGWAINVKYIGLYRTSREQWAALQPQIARVIYDRDGRKCAWCGRTEDLTIDHIVPLAAGGTHDLDNLQVLCRRCNSSKGAKVNG